MGSVLVLAGGDFAPATLARGGADWSAVVCVDRGLLHAVAARLHPDLLVGDFDSVPPALLAAHDSVPRLSFPPAKDASDLELALRALADGVPGGAIDNKVPDEVVVAGVSGGRTDHMLFNWLLPALGGWPYRLRLIDASTDAVVVAPGPPVAIAADVGDTVSLLPLGTARGVSTGGLRYALRDATLGPGTTLGLSNVAAAPSVSVGLDEGLLLLMRSVAPIEPAPDRDERATAAKGMGR